MCIRDRYSMYGNTARKQDVAVMFPINVIIVFYVVCMCKLTLCAAMKTMKTLPGSWFDD